MPYETITSRDNGLVKETVRLLSSSRARRQAGRFVLEGLRLCRDAVRSGCAPQTVLFTAALLAAHTADVEEICAAAGRCCCISDAVAQKLSDTPSPQGIFCILPIPQPPAFGGRGKYIGFEHLADPANLGAAARTAEALGLDGILLFGAGCDPYAPKAQRAAMGALVRLPVHTFPSVAEFAARYPAVNTYAAVVKGGIPVSQADFSAPCMVLIGNEANGLSEQAAALCTQRVTLPMYGRAESLNAAVAAAIFMWEMVR